MIKKALSALVICASLFAVAATAQTKPARQRQQVQQAGQCQAAPAQRCDSAACCQLFEGITLTDAQKAKLQELQKARAEKCTAAAQQSRQERAAAQKANRRSHLDDVKSVLTAEQYVTFLENAFLQQPQQGPRMGQPGQRKAAKPGKAAKAGKPGKTRAANARAAEAVEAMPVEAAEAATAK